MSWTRDEIARDWLAGAAIAVSPKEIVAAFNAADRLLGRDWIIAHRVQPGAITSGTAPTLAVVWVGQALLLVEGRRGTEKLLNHLKRGDRSAFAELLAVSLCVRDNSGIELEFESEVEGHTRRPDFRLRKETPEWIYIEVAAPDISVAQENARAVMGRLSEMISAVPQGTALDLSLRRDPTAEEIEQIASEMERLAIAGSSGVHELHGLASIAINVSAPSAFVLHDDGGPDMPRLGLARFEAPPGSAANKRVSVRYPFSDERAEEFLTREARQLPRDAPGLVMLDVTAAPGGFKSWKPLLARRLQPNIHTRVSAICLFEAGFESTDRGEGSVPHTSYIENPYAHRPLPLWLRNALQRFESRGAA